MNEIYEKYGIAADTDSYKFTHPAQYPEDTQYLFSYLESRGDVPVVFFGLRMVLQVLKNKLTHKQVDNIIEFQKAHLMGVDIPELELALRTVVDEYDGYMPILVRAVPEGTVVPGGNVLATIETIVPDRKIFSLVTYLETMLIRVWAPTTVATISRQIKRVIYDALLESSDDPDGEIPFKLHDFGSRGVSSPETAAINGAAHLVNFKGSDTVLGVMAANVVYYDAEMAGFSIPATEHSTTTAYGYADEHKIIETMFNKFAKPGGMFATVADSYDILNFIKSYSPKYKDRLIKSGATWIFRPDSGDPVKTPIKVVLELDKIFGHTINSKGYKVLNNVRVIQGDGIDIEDVRDILEHLLNNGYSATNMAFGMGSGLLQRNNRDTFRFAMKVSMKGTAADELVPVYKNPYEYELDDEFNVRYSGEGFKRSKAGELDLLEDHYGDLFTSDKLGSSYYDYLKYGCKSVLETVYLPGNLTTESFANITRRANRGFNDLEKNSS